MLDLVHGLVSVLEATAILIALMFAVAIASGLFDLIAGRTTLAEEKDRFKREWEKHG